MAESGLDSLKQTRDVVIEWKAYELRPGGKFPGTPEQEAAYRKMILEKHETMWAYARENFELEMHEGPWGVNSRQALEGARFAREHGLDSEYSHACFDTHWQAAERLDDMDVLVRVAESVGLDGDEFRSAVESGRYRDAVQADLDEAYQSGIQGVPAFVFADKYLVSGARPTPFLEQVIDKCIEEGLVIGE